MKISTMHTLYCQIKPYIQPFEKRLALKELFSLSGAKPGQKGDGSNLSGVFFVDTNESPKGLANRLAYWEYIIGKKPMPTKQILKEATTNIVRNGIPIKDIHRQLPFKDKIPLPNRRCLRYGPHGVHQYRGKFFPQLVLSLMNIAKVPSNGVVADPMCGSGTTAVESIIAGCQALGIDMNPLSVFMARTKCSLLNVNPDHLRDIYYYIRNRLLETNYIGRNDDLTYFYSLPSHDQAYLQKWFSKQVLVDLDKIATNIASQPEGPCKDLLWMSVSNILRKVSWQKETDLRVRKDMKLDSDIDPIREFLEELGRSVRMVLAFLYQVPNHRHMHFDIQQGDSRQLDSIWTKWAGKVDIVITSPPYATALPYIDTDRLSLIYLKLLGRSEHRVLDQLMIGNREVTEKVRQQQWGFFQSNKEFLPSSVAKLIEKIHQLNANANVGFRRRNLPALLSKYFFDMQDVFKGITKILRPGALTYVIVGNNHTIAGNQKTDIETADLLVDIAEIVGLACIDRIPMEMLVSRDIFRKNAVASEYILCFRRSD